MGGVLGHGVARLAVEGSARQTLPVSVAARPGWMNVGDRRLLATSIVIMRGILPLFKN